MLTIGLIREGKIPSDNRVALTPAQCNWIHKNIPGIKIIAQQSQTRCFTDKEYSLQGIEVTEDLSACDVILGIKEVPIPMLIPGKHYFFFLILKNYRPIINHFFRQL
jgi:alanine dehydrogenase